MENRVVWVTVIILGRVVSVVTRIREHLVSQALQPLLFYLDRLGRVLRGERKKEQTDQSQHTDNSVSRGISVRVISVWFCLFLSVST